MTPALGDAAKLAGISDKTGYNYRHDQEDTAFQAALKLARQMGNSRAEDEAWRRAVVGWREPVYQGGRLVGTKLVKSDTMLIFMLKGARPEKYRERFEHSGPAGGPIPTQATYDLSRLSDAELVSLDAMLTQAMAARVKEPAAVVVGHNGNGNGNGSASA